MTTEAVVLDARESMSPVALADDQLIQLAEQAEKRIAAVKRIKELALRVTNAHDWTDQGGKPYMQVSGAEKVARLFGISWRIDDPVFEQGEGGHFAYTYKGEFSLNGTTIEAIGSRSSKDGFFTKYEKQKDGERGERKALPPSEIDKGDVKKSAFTNLLGNGITRLLGIRNLSWEELETAGIKRDAVVGIQYKGKNQKNAKEQAGQGGQNPNLPATENQTKAVYALLSKLGVAKDAMPLEAAERLKFKDIGTLEKIEDLTRGQASELIKSLQVEANGQHDSGKSE